MSERGQCFTPAAEAQFLAGTARFGERGGKRELEGSAPSRQRIKSTRHREAAPGGGGKASSTGI